MSERVAIVDLDGTVYRGGTLIDGAADGLAHLVTQGIQSGTSRIARLRSLPTTPGVCRISVSTSILPRFVLPGR
jgi:hypothetical protein